VENELPKGTIVRKKGEQPEDESGWGGVGKNKKKGGNKNNGNKASSAEGASASTNDQLLNLPFGTLAALMGLGITAPLTTKEVSQTIDNLELKKKYFVDNQVSALLFQLGAVWRLRIFLRLQDRVTKERVAAVEKKINAAAESNGKSNGTSTPVAPEVAAVAHAEPTKAEEEVIEGAEEIAAPEKADGEVDEEKKDEE